MNKLYLSYFTNDTIVDIQTGDNYEDINVSIQILDNKIILFPKVPIKINKCEIKRDFIYNKNDIVYLNGFSCWSDTREAFLNEKERGYKYIPKSLIEKYALNSYGDYRIYEYKNTKGILHSTNYTYILRDDEVIFLGSLNDNEAYTIFEHDSNNNVITMIKDLNGVIIKDKLDILDLFEIKTSRNEAFEKYFNALGYSRKDIKRIVGYTSWYNHYQNISEDILKEELDSILDNDVFEVAQIDDGFEMFVGDWLGIDKSKFPNGLKPIVDKIHSRNKLAGIWLAPFAAETNSKLFKNHKDWLIKDENDRPLKAGHSWSGFYGLDMCNSEVIEYVDKVLDYYINLGFDLFKLDFIYAGCLLNNEDMSRSKMCRKTLEHIREKLKGKLILGCGVNLYNGYGLFDYCRTSNDVSLDFDDKFYMKYLHRERISTKNAIFTNIYRSMLDGFVFGVDPDVFLLRDDNIKLSDKQKEALLTINGMLGSVLFTSDNIGKYDNNKQKLFNDSLNRPDSFDFKTLNNGIEIECVKNGIKNKYIYNKNKGILNKVLD